jgi:hypothetical protein
MPEHHRANKNGQVPLATLIMEKLILHRNMDKNEMVHHIDYNPSNNRLENLQLMTISEHVKLHNKLKKRGTDGRFLPKLP